MSGPAICAECGMGLRDAAEFHPYRACELFTRSRNGDLTRDQLRREFPERADRHVDTGLPLGSGEGQP